MCPEKASWHASLARIHSNTQTCAKYPAAHMFAAAFRFQVSLSLPPPSPRALARPEELEVLLEMRVGEAAGLLCAGLGAVVARAAVAAGKALEGAVSAGVPAIRKAVSTVPQPCHMGGGEQGPDS